MKFLPLAAGLLLCTQALADPPADYTNHGQTPNNSGSGTGQLDPLNGARPHAENCLQLLERAGHMTDPTAPDKADAARQEVAMAHEALDNGDERACKRHAITAMEYRK